MVNDVLGFEWDRHKMTIFGSMKTWFRVCLFFRLELRWTEEASIDCLTCVNDIIEIGDRNTKPSQFYQYLIRVAIYAFVKYTNKRTKQNKFPIRSRIQIHVSGVRKRNKSQQSFGQITHTIPNREQRRKSCKEDPFVSPKRADLIEFILNVTKSKNNSHHLLSKK